jgi:hypothetical protein
MAPEFRSVNQPPQTQVSAGKISVGKVGAGQINIDVRVFFTPFIPNLDTSSQNPNVFPIHH